jgi:hypothetical protein
MADDPRPRLILIVVGTTPRAEEADRPLAYYLKQQVEAAAAAIEPEADAVPIRVLVVSDFRWLHDEAMQDRPTISLGGPGVNALAHRWLEELPLALAVDDQYYIQMDPELDEPRVSVWGMDNATTQVAVSAFLQRYLLSFLRHCATLPPEPEPSDDEEL